MPDDLYHRDFVLWSTDQTEKLRRLSRSEQVNDIDRLGQEVRVP